MSSKPSQILKASKAGAPQNSKFIIPSEILASEGTLWGAFPNSQVLPDASNIRGTYSCGIKVEGKMVIMISTTE